jgi:hypothetical protein
VKNADDVDALGGRAIKDHVRADGEFPVPGSHVVACCPMLGMDGDQFDAGLNLAQIGFGLVQAPLRDGIASDVLQVGRCQRR